ncbi:hypothetical protein D9619_002800 [Psilocybe cf. subviscida]|uniref:Uncharacterized protein n=1 Tax=Psilocybe cf. subviscida TaxID=2480587 RepID=A0A8H5AW19_9AGAR|nr:hypothetical protein D9619_002800 [Psilocybe cf. subviscida]
MTTATLLRTRRTPLIVWTSIETLLAGFVYARYKAVDPYAAKVPNKA